MHKRQAASASRIDNSDAGAHLVKSSRSENKRKEF
jgi:hypothetical protein